jgi:hypothetical protein
MTPGMARSDRPADDLTSLERSVCQGLLMTSWVLAATLEEVNRERADNMRSPFHV